MVERQGLVSELSRAVDDAVAGRGGLVLLAGEAGVGKTRLAMEVLEQTRARVLQVPATLARLSAYGPIVGALRAYRRTAEGGEALGRTALGAYLGMLLPEIGPPPSAADRATLFEAVREAFETIARQQPTVIFLDDLHAADSGTLELLPYLASQIEELPLLLLAAYRSDELGRDHPLRRMRAELRRGGRLCELHVDMLGPTETAALAAHALQDSVSPALASLIYERSDGLPLFVEELVGELAAAGRLRQTDRGLDLADDQRPLPIPETLRDVVLLRAARLSDGARAALDIAAVSGLVVDLKVCDLAGGEDCLAEALQAGLLVQTEEGSAAFRHALVRDVLYSAIARPRRRELHGTIAEWLQAQAVPSATLAEHWLAARNFERAHAAFVATMASATAVHAYTDAARAGRRALEVWPEGELAEERIAVLDRLGQCAQLSGDVAGAVSAWQEVAAAYEWRGETLQLAEVRRRLAGVYELQGDWERALAARESAAEGFAAWGLPAESAAERLAAAGHLRAASRVTAALSILEPARYEAAQAGRADLQARVMGLQGNLQARAGRHEAGLELVRDGLALALEHNHSAAAAEIYHRLADVHEHIGDYSMARQTYASAADFCQAQGAPAMANLCLACMAVVLRQTGEWQQCAQVCRDVLASDGIAPHPRAAALGMLGSIYAHQGHAARARPLLAESARLSRQIELAPLEVLVDWGLAMVDELDGAEEESANRCRDALARWAQIEERHYAIPAIRWAATRFATLGANADTRASANSLARIVTESSGTEAVAALGHALGEVSLLDGQPVQAVRHFLQSLERLEALELPFERAHTSLRAGLALVASGERQSGIERLVDAHRLAHKLGARPLANTAARELAALGEPIDRRLGKRAAGSLERGGLTRRELEVLRLVATGQTDREIAQQLVLSARTVEMHVANVLSKLGCRSRAEAVRRVAELQLLEPVRA